MTNSNTVTELRDKSKAALYEQAQAVTALAECGASGYNMEAMFFSGMIEMVKVLNLLSQDEIKSVIESANSDLEKK